MLDRTGVRLLMRQHRTGVRGVGNSVVGTLPCHAPIWQKSCDFGLYRPQPTIPDCLYRFIVLYLEPRKPTSRKVAIMSFVHTIYLENGYRFSVPDNDLADVAEKVINYVGKQFRRYTTSDIYGIANCELEFYLVNRLANEIFVGKEVDYTCVNAEDEKFLTLEILDKINVIIQ